MSRIPKVLHYIFGMASDFGGKPWSLVHHVCLKSAVERIAPEQVYFYYEFEPTGPWWELSRPLVTPVPISAPREIFGNRLDRVAHRADVVRLERLIEQGGIYLDADVLVQRSFDDLLDNSVVLGQEQHEREPGLANAVILAEPQAPFLLRWYEKYRTFKGGPPGTKNWNEHSVQLPRRLAQEHPSEITVLPPTAFFWPLWTEDHLAWMFASNQPIPPNGAYANHLWENFAWKHVEDLTVRRIRRIDTNFNVWARPLLEDLPDDYGEPTLLERYAKSWQKMLRKTSALKLRATKRLSSIRSLA